MNKIMLLAFIAITLALFVIFSKNNGVLPTLNKSNTQTPSPTNTVKNTFPLSLEYMRAQTYPGSDLQIEQTLRDGSNYHQYVASYKSDGYKIYGLLTVPIGESPMSGWPVIIFNHGYIPPEVYRTTERYVAYVDTFARSGYVVFKPDYRGHGASEGQPEGAYYSSAYTVDVLNALGSIKRFKDVDVNRIGMWGHSMGGNIALRSIEITKDIKAAVIWGGVVGSYDDLLNNWRRATPFQLSEREQTVRNRRRSEIIQKYGTPQTNPAFWNAIDLLHNVPSITVPVQIHHSTTDEEVPHLFAQHLDETMKKAGKQSELFIYEGDNHNISGNFNIAMQRSLQFFNKYVRGDK